jgi:hypothetical protein
MTETVRGHWLMAENGKFHLFTEDEDHAGGISFCGSTVREKLRHLNTDRCTDGAGNDLPKVHCQRCAREIAKRGRVEMSVSVIIER